MRPEGWTIVVVIVLAIVLFGAPKLPGLARSVGQSLRIFKSEVRQLKDESNPDIVAEDYSFTGQPGQPRPSNLAAPSTVDAHPTVGVHDGFPPQSR